MEIITFIIGFIIGVIGVALAIELGIKKTSPSEPLTRSTHGWSISELTNPRIVAEYFVDANIPKNSKLIVNQYKTTPHFDGVEVKQNSDVKGNFILGDDRALILAGPMKQDEIGVWTVEKEILKKLNAYFNDAWSSGTTLGKKDK